MRVRRHLVALLAAPLLLSACGGGSTSVADPPVSAPTSTPPSSDPPARESPQHFIRRWVKASNAMEMGGSTAAYLSLTANCHPCLDLAKQIAQARAHGGFYRSRGWKILHLSSGDGSTRVFVDVSVLSAPTMFKSSSSSSVTQYSGGRFTFRMFIERSAGAWTVTNVAQVGT